jgi:dienelactone hydrolase
MKTAKSKSKIRKTILISTVVFVLVFFAITMLIVKINYDNNFCRFDASDYSTYLRYNDITGYERTQVSFFSGKNKLAGYIYGEENNKGLIVIAHGLGSGAERYLTDTMYFVDNGWRVFAYDCTGSYNSEGKSTKGLPQSALDLDAALTYIESQNWGLPIMLYGHSWGGFAVTAVLNYEHDINAVVSLAGYATPMKMLQEQAENMIGRAAILTYPSTWIYQKLLFGKVADLSAIKGINKNNVPVMIVHGLADETILYNGAGIIAHKGKITNPNVIYITRDSENQNGHIKLFLSKRAADYIDAIDEGYKDISNSYNGNIPDNIKTDFYSKIDRVLANELDPTFMNDINAFFEKYLTSENKQPDAAEGDTQKEEESNIP